MGLSEWTEIRIEVGDVLQTERKARDLEKNTHRLLPVDAPVVCLEHEELVPCEAYTSRLRTTGVLETLDDSFLLLNCDLRAEIEASGHVDVPDDSRDRVVGSDDVEEQAFAGKREEAIAVN
jgi:hypothetical protein